MTVNEIYTRKQAMERLGIKSTNAFKHLEKKNPAAFIIVKSAHDKHPHYDKTTLDEFAELRQKPTQA